MTPLIDFLEALASLALGVVGRTGLFLAAGLAIALPALAIALAWRALRGLRRTGVHDDARLAPNHTWVAPRGRRALAVGVDEIAGRILPSATAVELPACGMRVHRGDPIAVVRAGKRAVRIGAPVDGTVVGTNRRVVHDPALVKDDPYGSGWLFVIEPSDGSWRELPHGPSALAWLASERRRLARFIEDELGIAAADGGDLVAPAPALLGDRGWERVVASFLSATSAAA